jgi:hypothetical protein
MVCTKSITVHCKSDMYILYNNGGQPNIHALLPCHCKPDNLGISKLGQNLIPQGLAKEIRFTIHKRKVKQSEDVFHGKFPRPIVVYADKVSCYEYLNFSLL